MYVETSLGSAYAKQNTMQKYTMELSSTKRDKETKINVPQPVPYPRGIIVQMCEGLHQAAKQGRNDQGFPTNVNVCSTLIRSLPIKPELRPCATLRLNCH
jgi:hypothetical protein